MSAGLYDKYRVERRDGKPLKGGFCIVLEVGDPHARPAISQWAETMHSIGLEELASDVRQMLIAQPVCQRESAEEAPGG